MSGIAGIHNFAPQQVDPRELLLLGSALSERGPDGGNGVLAGPTGMVYRAFHTNAESRDERQPLLSPSGHILCWDGRLDNRDDLVAGFGGEFCGERTDASLVLAAYLNRGDAFLPRLVGDFALSLWDPLRRVLLLARDPFGVRPLYYHRSDERIVWSSTLSSLLALRGIETEVNDEYVAGCFALYPELSSTPYRDLIAVEPGQVVTIAEGRLHTARFWRPEQKDEICYANDEQYEEQFRQLFREAVRARLRSDRPVWSELSGGLDSSSIVFMADRIATEQPSTAAPVTTLSFVDHPSVTFFDHRFIDVVEKARGREGVHIDGAGRWIELASPDDPSLVTPLATLCVAGLHERVWEIMSRAGARVLLSGLGGDQLAWSNLEPGPELSDLFAACKPIALHRRLRVWSEATHMPYAQLLWQEVMLPFLPRAVRGRFQKQIQLSSWLEPDFVKRTNVHERLVLPQDPYNFKLPSRRLQSSRIWYIVMNIARGEHWEHAVYEKTYPFLHRPLVEFVLNVPVTQQLRPDETRSLMRRALKDLLPKRILERRNKGTTGEALCRGLAREWPRIRPLFDDARLARRGYVNVQELVRALDRARHGVEFNISGLLQAVALEVWLRSLEYKRSDVRARYKSIERDGPRAWTNRPARAFGAA